MIFEKIRERLKEKSFVDYEEYYTDNGECLISISDTIGIINQVEAEYNNGWIPCDKEQPNKDGYYLILTSDGEIDVREYDYGNGWGWDGFERITHWQPLPQPPKGE
jgi:hypothetical protein